jgi:hypothetical protein
MNRSRGFFCQKFFKRFCEDTLGISGPTVFPPAVARLLLSILFGLMILAVEAGFD